MKLHHFVQEMKKNTLKYGLDTKMDAKRDAKSSFCCSDKLVMMGTIKPSKDQALVAGDSRVDSESKNKAKNPPDQKRDKNKSPEDPQGSKKNF